MKTITTEIDKTEIRVLLREYELATLLGKKTDAIRVAYWEEYLRESIEYSTPYERDILHSLLKIHLSETELIHPPEEMFRWSKQIDEDRENWKMLQAELTMNEIDWLMNYYQEALKTGKETKLSFSIKYASLCSFHEADRAGHWVTQKILLKRNK